MTLLEGYKPKNPDTLTAVGFAVMGSNLLVFVWNAPASMMAPEQFAPYFVIGVSGCFTAMLGLMRATNADPGADPQ